MAEGEGGYHGGNGGSKIDIQPHHSRTAPSRTGVSSPSHATPSGGNGGSKMGVTGSHSNTAPSRTGVSSPSKRNSSSQFSSFVANSV